MPQRPAPTQRGTGTRGTGFGGGGGGTTQNPLLRGAAPTPRDSAPRGAAPAALQGAELPLSVVLKPRSPGC